VKAFTGKLVEAISAKRGRFFEIVFSSLQKRMFRKIWNVAYIGFVGQCVWRLMEEVPHGDKP